MVRSFSGRQPSSEAVDAILAAGVQGPSAGNTDGWDAVVLEGPEETSSFWEATTTADWRNRSRRWPGLSRAPLVICVFCRPRAYLDRYSQPDKKGAGLGLVEHGDDVEAAAAAWPIPFWFVDAGFAALLMLLAAADAGLGACILGNFRGEAELSSALGVPEDRRYVCALLVGEVGGEDPPSASLSVDRREPKDAIHRGSW